MSLKPRHRIITFYSYKGGTGRSMALANVACLLAQRAVLQDRILIIDWDLEAPGLHRYFRPYLQSRFPRPKERDEEFDRHSGLVDLFLQLDQVTRSEDWKGKEESEEEARTLAESIDLKNFVVETDIDQLDFLKAGDFGEKYSSDVNTFQWEAFYQRSPSLFRFFAERLTEEYAYVLIDSRTGVTDISGICTMLMPDNLVAVFTPNRQSIEGVLDLIRRATDFRRQSEDLRPLVVFPLVSRVDGTRTSDRLLWRHGSADRHGTPDPEIPAYQPLLEQLFKEVYNLPQCDLGDYFDEIFIPHYPEYAYGEKVAVKEEGGADRFSATRTYEDFTEKLVSLAAPWEDLSPAKPQSRPIAEPPTAEKSLRHLVKFTLTRPVIPLFSAGLLVAVVGVVAALWGTGVIGVPFAQAPGSTVQIAPVASVSVTPEATTIIEGQRLLPNVTLKDDKGNILLDRMLTWSSSDPAVATVESTRGMVTGITPGVATITATAEGQSGAATISVIPVPVTFVSVTPDTATVIGGRRVQLRAILRDVEGNVLPGREVTWSSSNAEVATVDGKTGVVTGRSPGTADIIATSEGRRGTATVGVILVPLASVSVGPAAATIVEGKSIALTAKLRDDLGNELTDRRVVWVSSNPEVATVDARIGVVIGRAPGATTITATAEGRTGAATVTVTPVPVATIELTPEMATVIEGGRVLLKVTLKDAESNTVTRRQVTWFSSNTGVAVVDASGLVVGITPGVGAITATAEGKSDTAVVTVLPAPVKK